jgi:uncharacterized membrane protein
MMTRADQSITALKKSILLSNLTTYTVKFNSKLNKFVLGGQYVKIFSAIRIFVITIWVIFFAYLLVEKPIKKTFIIKVTNIFYLAVDHFFAISVLIADKKYEKTTVNITNKLIQLQKELSGHFGIIFPKRYTSTFFCYTTMISFLLTILCTVDYIIKEVQFFSWLDFILYFSILFTHFMKTMSFARFNALFLTIGNYFEHLNEHFVISSRSRRKRIIQIHKELNDLSKDANDIFSFTLLFSIAFFFLAIVSKVIQIYCLIVLHLNSIKNRELVDFILNIYRLTFLIYISNRCMYQVKERSHIKTI